MEFYTIQILIPALDPLYWLVGLGVFILIVSWLMTNWPYKVQLERLPKVSERFGANAIAYLATLFVPVWIALVLLTLSAIYRLGFFPAPPSDGEILANRLHYLALVGLMGALAALLGTPLALYRVFTTERQTKATEDGLITDRINKAVEGIGATKIVKRQRKKENGKLAYESDLNGNPDFSKPIYEEISEPNLEVRIGSLYALERISQDSSRDYLQILEIICAYIRENSPAANLTETITLLQRPRVRSDIQTAITIIARRNKNQISVEWKNYFHLDLRECDLSGVDFEGGDFSAAKFHRCRLEAAIFSDCKLEGTQFFGSILNYADFDRAKFIGTRLDAVILNLPNIQAGGMSNSITMADVHSMIVSDADLSEINYLGEAKDTNKIFGTKDTKLHYEIDFDRNKNKPFWKEIRKLRRENKNNLADDREQEVASTESFLYWPPFGSQDLAIQMFLEPFNKKHGLNSWPHRKISRE